MYRLRGIGSDAGAFSTECGGGLDALNQDCWSNIWGLSWFAPSAPKQVLAPPQAPTGAVLTVPPASAAEAQATVDELLNQQLRDQQALNAAQVRSSVWDETLGGAAIAGDAVTSAVAGAFNWLPWLLGGLGVFAVVALSAGGPRRYGR